jgi:hypothetical protein
MTACEVLSGHLNIWMDVTLVFNVMTPFHEVQSIMSDFLGILQSTALMKIYP